MGFYLVGRVGAFMCFFRFETLRICWDTWPTCIIIHFYLCFSPTIPIRPPPLVLLLLLPFFPQFPYHFVPFPSRPLPFSSSTRDVWHGGLWLTQKIDHTAGKLLLCHGGKEFQSIDVREDKSEIRRYI